MDESLTVVIPTHRRPAGLARVLKGLAGQDDPGVPWDVIVIDNDSQPNSRATFEAVGLPVASRLVHEPRLGSAHARNRGVTEATGSIIAFLDDDVVPEPGWLRALIAPILDGRCTGTGGRVMLDPSVPRPRWYATWMAGYLSEYHPAEREVDLREIPDPVLFEPYILTANAAFRRDLLRAVGGFDPLLGPRVGVPMVNDDVSPSRRFLAAGGTILYVPEARVEHELPAHRLTRRYIIRRFYGQGRSDWLLDREFHSQWRFGGLRGTIGAFFKGAVAGALLGRIPEKRVTWLWCDGARRLGLLREALAFSLRRRRAAR